MTLAADVKSKLDDKNRADEINFLMKQVESTNAVINGCLSYADHDFTTTESYMKEAHERVEFIKKLNDEDFQFVECSKTKISDAKTSLSLDNNKIRARFDALVVRPEFEAEQNQIVQEKLEKLEHALQQVESEFEEVEQELRSFEETLTDLQSQIDQENRAIEEIQNEKVSIDDKIVETETAINELIAEDTLWDDHLDELYWTRALKDIEDRYNDALQEHDKMEMDLQKIEDYSTRLSNEIEEGRIELEMLKEQIKQHSVSSPPPSMPPPVSTPLPTFAQPTAPALKFLKTPLKPTVAVPEKKMALQNGATVVTAKPEPKKEEPKDNKPLPLDETMGSDLDQSMWGTDF